MKEDILREARRLADEVFRPRAELTDQAGIRGPIAENIGLLAAAGYFGLGIDPAYGGMGADDRTRQEFTEVIASACGVTAFTQQQFHSGGGFFGSVEDESIKAELLPELAAGRNLCGIAFSHLRRTGPPMVTAKRSADGFVINGKAPWVTGWSLLHSLVLGATVEDSGDHLFVYVPKAGNEERLAPGPQLPLAVMAASDTVEVSLQDLFVHKRYIVSERLADALRRADFCGISGHVFLPLGCTRGSIYYLRELAQKRNNESIGAVADALEREADHCRREALAWSGACADMPDYKEHALRARAAAIILAVRAAHATVTATGGAAHLLTNPPQRLLREAMFYTTVAQTPDVQSGTLDLLILPEGRQETINDVLTL